MKKTIQKILSAIDDLQLHKKATIQKEANLVFFFQRRKIWMHNIRIQKKIYVFSKIQNFYKR